MDSLFGILHRDGQPASARMVEPMAQAMSKLGYSGNEEYREGSVALGAAVAHSRQTSTVLVSDSRLDDRQTLCERLNVAAPDRRDITDSQLILAAWQKWGEDCPRYLLGDYSFAIWNPGTQELFCARDHIGARPFYYYYDDRVFVFASDIRGLLACPETPRKLDDAYVAAYCRQVTFTHPSRTFYADQLKLPPGHTITVSTAGTPQLRAYWTPEDAPEIRLKSTEEYAEGLQERIREAVRDRIGSENAVGAHISGGLDCSSVAVLAARQLRQVGSSLQAFAWSSPHLPGEPESTSTQIIEEIGRLEDFPIHYRAQLSSQWWLRDVSCEPTFDMGSEVDVGPDAASRGVRLMLSGWGGDEAASFNGRGYYAEQFRHGKWVTLLRELYARGRISSNSRLKGLIGIPKQFWGRVLTPLTASLESPTKELTDCFNDDFAAQLSEVVPLTVAMPRFIDVRSTMQGLVSRGHLAHRMEHWAAHGAAFGLTYAYPLTDRRVLEFSLGIPCEQFVHEGRTRMLYRRAVKDVLPARSMWSSKQDQAVNFDADHWRSRTCKELTTFLKDRQTDPDWGHCIDFERTLNRLKSLMALDRPWENRENKSLKKTLLAVSAEVMYHHHVCQTRIPVAA